ncbi:ankyrin repeat and MYND domain-containing protein 2-like [Sycon ciliatum]|uniref:ankyrin repeat and MYND domain-containing protein 2-like n=1 Tax=Sycon ciliatum TaxID=27933 RepID=UPI0031F60899
MAVASPDLVKVIQEGGVDDVRKHLADNPAPIDSADEDGMTLLMHAAYKGKVDTCKLLLARKADVNWSKHEHGYTALMFGAMSGSTEVARILLEAGANPNKQNNIGRNAAQLAAFIGHSAVGLVINSFFQRSTLDYYSVPHGVETQPKLPPYVVSPLYELLSTTNIHPINLLFCIQSNPELLHEVKKVRAVIELLVEKQYKELVNEVLSIKFHLISAVLQFAAKASASDTDTGPNSIDAKIKILLRGREEDGFPAFMEAFLRQSIRDYPYHTSVMLEQLVRTISPVKVGDSPTSLRALHSLLFGLQMYDESKHCVTCGTGQNVRRCTGCSQVSYCGRKCQSLHWFTHKKHCKAAASSSSGSSKKKPSSSTGATSSS